MELAVHLRDAEQGEHLFRFPQPLTEQIDRLFHGPSPLKVNFIQGIGRMYIGDEFCINRLPTPAEFMSLCELADQKKLEVTLLTPVITNEGFEKCSILLDLLKERDPQSEVVVNDWGMALFVKENYPSMRLAVGRALNKGFKDPRLLNREQVAAHSTEAEELLSYNSFDSPEIQGKMTEMGIVRMEMDLLPYSVSIRKEVPDLKTSWYFPFGYITTGRVCWPASFRQPPSRKFRITHSCPRPCNSVYLELESADASFEVFQSGNTVFYRYTPSMVSLLFNGSGAEGARLVYQGPAMGAA